MFLNIETDQTRCCLSLPVVRKGNYSTVALKFLGEILAALSHWGICYLLQQDENCTALTCLKPQRGTVCKVGCRSLSRSCFVGFWDCCPRRGTLRGFSVGKYMLLLNSAIRYTRANSKRWGVSIHPKTETASFIIKITQVLCKLLDLRAPLSSLVQVHIQPVSPFCTLA